MPTSRDAVPGTGQIPLVALLGAVKSALTAEIEGRIHAAGYPDLSLANAANVLRWLKAGPRRPGDLTRDCDVTKQALSLQIGGLERRGYLTSTPDPTDGRARLVELTDRGRAAIATVESIFGEVEADWAAGYGPDAVGSVRSGLTELLGALRAGLDPAPEACTLPVSGAQSGGPDCG